MRISTFTTYTKNFLPEEMSRTAAGNPVKNFSLQASRFWAAGGSSSEEEEDDNSSVEDSDVDDSSSSSDDDGQAARNKYGPPLATSPGRDSTGRLTAITGQFGQMFFLAPLPMGRGGGT